MAVPSVCCYARHKYRIAGLTLLLFRQFVYRFRLKAGTFVLFHITSLIPFHRISSCCGPFSAVRLSSPALLHSFLVLCNICRLTRSRFWHRARRRPWQQLARRVCRNRLLILYPIYGRLGGFLLLKQKALCLEAPPATSSTKSCIYMRDSVSLS